MKSTTILPLNCIKSDQDFYVSYDRDYTGQYVITGQLTKDQYVSLDGMKIKSQNGIVITGKRWTKVIPVDSYHGMIWHDGDTIQLDRVYISTYRKGTRYQLGYIEVSQDSGMPMDTTGNKGCTVFNVQPTSEDIVQAIQSFIESL